MRKTGELLCKGRAPSAANTGVYRKGRHTGVKERQAMFGKKLGGDHAIRKF